MWTIKVDAALLQALLAYDPKDRAESAVITYVLMRALEVERSGEITLHSHIGKRLRAMIAIDRLAWDSK